MALQQNNVVDMIEVTQNGVIQIRERNDIIDDATPNTIIASTFHRTSLIPGASLDNQTSRVVAIANAVWTPEVIAAYEAQQKANKNGAVE